MRHRPATGRRATRTAAACSTRWGWAGDLRLHSGVNELPSAVLTTKFLDLCKQYGSERLAVRIIAAGRSAGVSGLPDNDDSTVWNADEMRAAVEHLQRKRGTRVPRR